MKLSLVARAGGLTLAFAGPSMAATPLTPQQAYQENVLCAAAMQQAVGENLLAPRYPPDKVEPLARLYLDKAQKTGAALGVQSAEVTAAEGYPRRPAPAEMTRRCSVLTAMGAPPCSRRSRDASLEPLTAAPRDG